MLWLTGGQDDDRATPPSPAGGSAAAAAGWFATALLQVGYVAEPPDSRLAQTSRVESRSKSKQSCQGLECYCNTVVQEAQNFLKSPAAAWSPPPSSSALTRAPATASPASTALCRQDGPSKARRRPRIGRRRRRRRSGPQPRHRPTSMPAAAKSWTVTALFRRRPTSTAVAGGGAAGQ